MLISQEALDKINAELDEWVEGDVISRQRVDEFGTTIAVIKGKIFYRVLRAFGLGEGAGVSVDLQTERVEDVVEHLLCHYKV